MVKVRVEGEVVDYEFLMEGMRDWRLEGCEDEVERKALLDAQWCGFNRSVRMVRRLRMKSDWWGLGLEI